MPAGEGEGEGYRPQELPAGRSAAKVPVVPPADGRARSQGPAGRAHPYKTTTTTILDLDPLIVASSHVYTAGASTGTP